MSETNFSRTINIYIDSGEAQAAYDKLSADTIKLTGHVEDLKQKYAAAMEKAAVEGTKKAQDAVAKLGAELEKTQSHVDNNTASLDRLSKKISGELSPNLKDLQATSRKLNQELNQMSKEDAGFPEKTKQALEAKRAVEEYLGVLGRTKAAAHEAAHEGMGGEIFKVATGVTAANAAEKVFEEVKELGKESLDEAIKEEDIASRLQNSLEGVGRKDLFKPLMEQAEKLGDKFRFVLPDDIKDTEDKLVTFGKLSKNQIDSILPVIINLSAKIRKSLPEATDIMLKGFSGLEGMDKTFHKLGVELDKNGSFAANFTTIMSQLPPKVDGAGEALERVAKGGLADFNVMLTESKKWLGEQLLPYLTGFLNIVKGIKTASESLVDSFNHQNDKVKDLTTNINPLLDRYDELKGKTNLTKGEQDELKGIIEKVAAVIPSAISEVDKYGKALGLNTQQAKDFIKQQTLMLQLKNRDAIDEQTGSLKKLELQYASVSQQLDGMLKGSGKFQKEIMVSPFTKDEDIPGLVKRTGPMQALVKQDMSAAIEEFSKKKGELAGKVEDAKLLLQGLKGDKPEEKKNPNDDKAMDDMYKAFDLTKIAGIKEKLETLQDDLKRATIGSDVFKKLQEEIKVTEKLLLEAEGKVKETGDEWKKFQEKVANLRAETQAKEKSADALELEKLKEKFTALEEESKKFHTKGIASLAQYNAIRKELTKLYAKEVEDLEDKQYGSKMEKELTASQNAITKYYDDLKDKAKEQFALQLIGKDQYDKQVETLDSQSKHALAINYESYYEALKEAAKGDAAKLAKIESDKVKVNQAAYIQDVDNYIKEQARKDTRTANQDSADVITTGMGNDAFAKRDARLKQVEDELAKKLALVKGNEEAINLAMAEAAQKRQAIEKSTYDEISGDIKKYGDDAVKIFSGIEQIASNIANANLAKDKLANKQKEENLKAQLDHGQISQKQYNDAMAALQKKQTEEENKIAKEQFAMQKGLKLAQAVINVAAGVANALGSAPPPMNFINAAIVGAAGGIEIGVIASQQFVPKAEEGMLVGQSHKQGGIHIEAEDGEAIISKNTTAANRPIINSLLSAKGRPVINSTRAIENNQIAQGHHATSTATNSTGQQHLESTSTGNNMDELTGHIKTLITVTKQAQDKKVTFVQNEYNDKANQQAVVYQQSI